MEIKFYSYDNGREILEIRKKELLIKVSCPISRGWQPSPVTEKNTFSVSLFQESRVHILINNACVQWVPYEKTPEGFEMHFGVNHIGSFVMTQLLMPLLSRASPDARIINVGSR